MKTYVEMAESALGRIAEYEEKRRIRKNRLVRAAVPAVSFCLVALLGIGVVKSGLPSGNNGEAGRNPSVGSVAGPGGETAKNGGNAPEVADQIVINQASSSASADMDVQMEEFSEKLPPWVWEQIMEEFDAFCGMNYEDFTARLSGTTNVTRFYSLKTRGYKDGDRTDDYLLHDYVFVCETAGGGNVTLALCSTGAPLRDVFVVCENPKQSVINGNTLEIIQIGDYYQASFTYRNVNYDLDARGVTQEELEALLKDILR